MNSRAYDAVEETGKVRERPGQTFLKVKWVRIENSISSDIWNEMCWGKSGEKMKQKLENK